MEKSILPPGLNSGFLELTEMDKLLRKKLFFLIYNQAMTGDPFRFPIMAYADKTMGTGANALGFGPEKGVSWSGADPFPGHGLADVMVNALLNTVATNIELFGWGIGSLLVILQFT